MTEYLNILINSKIYHFRFNSTVCLNLTSDGQGIRPRPDRSRSPPPRQNRQPLQIGSQTNTHAGPRASSGLAPKGIIHLFDLQKVQLAQFTPQNPNNQTLPPRFPRFRGQTRRVLPDIIQQRGNQGVPRHPQKQGRAQGTPRSIADLPLPDKQG